jgi:hypothetical protein
MKDNVEQIIVKQIKSEYDTAKSNRQTDNSDFEAIIDLLECKRTEKSYSWLSDVFYPEYPAVLLTESSQWASQYFSSREYVDVYLEGDGPNDKDKCAGVKKLVNKTLNRKDLYHYHKYMRARTINSTAGVVYAVCGWEQKLKPTIVGKRKVPDGTVVQLENGITVPSFKDENIVADLPLKDNFAYDIIDPRNVFTDNTYCYSVQEKEWIIIRSEESYETLKYNEDSHGYFNLDKIQEILKSGGNTETETSKESYNKEEQNSKVDKPVSKHGDVLTRYGKMWVVVSERDEDGNPIKVEYGYDDLGGIKENAELIEGISGVFMYGGKTVLIRHQATPFIDALGNPYKPIIRGLCYIHPTKDTGMSDGKYARESQVALNDTINISNDRVKLATMPVFVGDKYACEENDEIYMEPEHIIPMEGGPDKIRELQVRDNIAGAMQQANMFIAGIHNVTSIFPNTMGDVGAASTTATAVAGADMRSNTRQNYKALTYEHTFLCNLYWMILQMSYRFMHPVTAEKLLGKEGVLLFDPTSDYTYQPITSAIEQEHGKHRKLQVIDQMLGRLVNVPNPKTPKLINKLMAMAFDLLGADYQEFEDALLDEGPVAQQAAIGVIKQDQPTNQGMPMGMTSNQSGLPVSSPEMMARTAYNG